MFETTIGKVNHVISSGHLRSETRHHHRSTFTSNHFLMIFNAFYFEIGMLVFGSLVLLKDSTITLFLLVFILHHKELEKNNE